MFKSIVFALIVLMTISILSSSLGIAQRQTNIELPVPSSDWLSTLSGLGSKVQSAILGGSMMVDPTSPNSFLLNPALASQGFSTRATAQFGHHDDGTNLGSLSVSVENFGFAAAGFTGNRLPFADKEDNPDLIPREGAVGMVSLGKTFFNALSLGLGVKPMYAELQESGEGDRAITQQLYGASADVGFHIALGNIAEIGGTVQDIGSAINIQNMDDNEQEIETVGSVLEPQYKLGGAVNLGTSIRLFSDMENYKGKNLYRMGGAVRLPYVPVTVWGTTAGGENIHPRVINAITR